MANTFDYFDEPPHYDKIKELPRDPVIDEARAAVEDYTNKNQMTVCYLKQFQVIFERTFYHWITAKAISELVTAGLLRDRLLPLHEHPEGRTATVRFIFHPRNRYTKRVIQKKLNLIRRFSTEEIGRACGRHAEILFSRALLAKGFRLITEKARTYQDREWTETGHDLDFIFERDGFAYGCEIKNRFEYIDREEMHIKMRMCKHLGVTPLFIMRAAPKSYLYEIWQGRGFFKIFQTHIFPYGFESLVQEIREEFVGLPVDCPRDLPNTILDRFVELHTQRLSAAGR